MMIKLLGYQQQCVDYIKNNFGLILYHSMGSGKTITSLEMMYQFPNDIIIISTKASRKNFSDDIKKIKLNLKRIKIYTYQKAISLILGKELSFTNHSVIIDEAHHLRSVTKLLSILISECRNAYKIVLLTGTIFYNSLTDLSVLVNIIKKEDVLPETTKEFKFFYYDETYETPTNTEIFVEKIKKSISYYKKTLDDHYPTSTITYIKVDMNNAQISEYRHYLKKILSLDSLQHIDYNRLDKRKVNNFLSVTRQLSNTVDNSPDSPKIIELFEYIKNNVKPVVVYSNFLNNGVLPLSYWLDKEKIKYAIYFGEQNEEKKKSNY